MCIPLQVVNDWGLSRVIRLPRKTRRQGRTGGGQGNKTGEDERDRTRGAAEEELRGSMRSLLPQLQLDPPPEEEQNKTAQPTEQNWTQDEER